MYLEVFVAIRFGQLFATLEVFVVICYGQVASLLCGGLSWYFLEGNVVVFSAVECCGVLYDEVLRFFR